MYRALIAAAAVFALTGCNTVAGFGNDVSAVGTALTSAANDSAKPAPKKQTAAKRAPTTKVAAKSTTTKTASKKATTTKVAATKPAKRTVKKSAPEPVVVDVVDTGKPFKPGK